MLELNHRVQVVLPGVQLADHPGNALHIGSRIGQHQRVGRHRRADITIGRHQRSHQPGNIGGTAGVQADDFGHELRRRGGFYRALAGPCPGLGNRGDENPVALIDHREVVGVEHRIEQPTHPFTIEGLPGHDGDTTGDFGVQHHGGSQNAGDLFDDVAQLSVVHRQLPSFFSAKRARKGCSRQNGKQKHGAQPMHTDEAVHEIHHSGCPESGRKKRVVVVTG
ncbi:hypothetical protein D3C81_766110 [compost metagenome]